MTTERDPNSDIDIEALARRYAEEREKRLRGDAVSQYQHLEGKFATFDADPNAVPDLVRDAVIREVDVLVIGGGYGGLLTAIQLRKRGVGTISIIEKGADFGGTWYWNRYPGIRCDVESYIYLPLLEETGFVPSERYARGEEIYTQCRLLAEKFDLYRDALFQTLAESLIWDEKNRRWTVTTNRGDRIEARFVVSATGLYSSPKLPGIPGIETFEGPSFHTSRWDYGFTGGSADGDLVGLHGKTVGIIGTGSTGIQCVPPVARAAAHLYLFQRTPASVDVRGNRPTDVEWYRAQPPGWQRERMMNFTQWTSGLPQAVDMVSDSMTDLFREKAVSSGMEMTPEQREAAEILKMERVRQRIDSIVENKETAAALKPYFHYFCKRPGFSDNYLQVFNRSNVTLVDTAGQGVEKVTPRGLVVGGREYALDCIIYATGFDFMTSYTRESGLTVKGRGGVSLDERWKDGVHTLFGMQTRGFPNFFVLTIVQAGTSINYLHTADAQSIYMADLIAHCMSNGIETVEPTQEAEQQWVDLCVSLSADRHAFFEKCTPSYFNFEGKRPREFELNSPFGGGPLAYFEYLEQMSANGFAEKLEFH
ncbi:monooxygenase [Sphingobium jiangsuense]|uniref:Cyclohexanone monooxygenase n=1 Tax=Sphingobium jiangsuense TaxID=870476 RepID=A0A7W6FQF2_9SPHN|nr:NAD(P)/FAD-dependent oxidoreductase [Sphingobium jiangsuense]MBB3926880.1 cyclohexanone monooxygenase [Sphingobium jiangsuense]GLS98888.1 monooxygenase [Sphingobium jiangsuense]